MSIDSFKKKGKNAVAFARSFLSKKPVNTGYGFTTSDQSLTDQQAAVVKEKISTRHRVYPASAAKPGPLAAPGMIARYVMDESVVFELDGFHLVDGINTAHVKDTRDGKVYALPFSYFTRYFKLMA